MRRVSQLLILVLLICMLGQALYVPLHVNAQTETTFCPAYHGDYDYNYIMLNNKKIPVDVMRRWVFDYVYYVLGNGTNLEDWGKVVVKLQSTGYYKIYGSYPAYFLVKACILDGTSRTFTNCTVVLNTTSVGEYTIDLKQYMNQTGWSNIYLIAEAWDANGVAVLRDAVHLLFYWGTMTNDWQQYVDVYVNPAWPSSYPGLMYFILTISSTDTNAYNLIASANGDYRLIKVVAVDNNGLEWPVNYMVIPNDTGYIIPVIAYVNNTGAWNYGGQLHLRIYLLKYPIGDWLSYTYKPTGSVTADVFNTVTDNGWGIAVLNKLAAPSDTGYKSTFVPTDSFSITGHLLYIVAMDGDEQNDGWGAGYIYSGTTYLKFRWLQTNYPEHYLSTSTWFSFAPSATAVRDGMTNIFYVDYVNDKVTWVRKYFDSGTDEDIYTNLGAQLVESTTTTNYVIITRYYSAGQWLSNPVVYYARGIALSGNFYGPSLVGNIITPSDDLSQYCYVPTTTTTPSTSTPATTSTTLNVPALLLWLLPLIILLISIAALGLAGGIAVAVAPIIALAFAGLVPIWFVLSLIVGLLLATAFLKRGGGGG